MVTKIDEKIKFEEDWSDLEGKTVSRDNHGKDI